MMAKVMSISEVRGLSPNLCTLLETEISLCLVPNLVSWLRALSFSFWVGHSEHHQGGGDSRRASWSSGWLRPSNHISPMFAGRWGAGLAFHGLMLIGWVGGHELGGRAGSQSSSGPGPKTANPGDPHEDFLSLGERTIRSVSFTHDPALPGQLPPEPIACPPDSHPPPAPQQAWLCGDTEVLVFASFSPICRSHLELKF